MQNIYEYLKEHFDLAREIAGSDFEKFAYICRTLADLSGNQLYFDVHKQLEEYFGERVEISANRAEYLWRRFNGEDVTVSDGCSELLNVRYLCADELENVIKISDITQFVSPDVYHVSLARARSESGEDLSVDEKNMLMIQRIRDTAGESVLQGKPLILDMRCGGAEVFLSVYGYLSHSKLLPKILLICDISEGTRLLYKGVDICVFGDGNVQKIAENMPVGRTVLLTESASKLEGELKALLSVWQQNARAPRKVVLAMQKYPINY